MSDSSEIMSTSLSLIVLFEDDFTKGRPICLPDVSIEGLKTRPIRTPGSRFAFMNIPWGQHLLKVISDIYFSESLKVAPSSEKDRPMYPPIKINLRPRPSYAFPPGATLIRGILRKRGRPIVGALIKGKAQAGDFSIATDRGGDFVIYFRDIEEKDVVIIEGKACLKGPKTESLDPSEIPIEIEFYEGDNKVKVAGRSFQGNILGRSNSRIIDLP